MFHLSNEMKIQLLCFAALVVVCVAGTRLIYHDGIVGDIRRMKWHCQMQAALILILCGWAGSIGFRINESCVAIIEQQSEVIEELQAMRGSSVNKIPEMTIVTAAGNKITFGGLSNVVRSGDRCVGNSRGQLDGNYTGQPSNQGTARPNGLSGNDNNVRGLLVPVPVPIRRNVATDFAASGIDF